MDSCQSGSVQSSSGGVGGGGDQDEYDSRTQTLSAFFNPTTTTSATTNTTRFIPPTPLYNNHHHHFNRVDPDSMWPRIMRSEPNCNPTAGSDYLPKAPQITATGNRIPPARNPKKRSRASRRAPTTVLTTDTANFRAMVQEFTGIPSPPFVGGRFDLFGTPPSVIRSLAAPPLPYPLLRPFPQKFHPSPPPEVEEEEQPFLLPTYQLPRSNMQNPIFNLQSVVLQPATKMGGFGSGQTELHGLPNLVSSEEASRPHGNSDHQTNWVDGDGVDGSVRSIGRGGGGGGMVDTWLCSTD